MANTSAIYVAGFLPSFLIDSIHVATILSSPMFVFRIQVVRGRLRAITVNEDVSRRFKVCIRTVGVYCMHIHVWSTPYAFAMLATMVI